MVPPQNIQLDQIRSKLDAFGVIADKPLAGFGTSTLAQALGTHFWSQQDLYRRLQHEQYGSDFWTILFTRMNFIAGVSFLLGVMSLASGQNLWAAAAATAVGGFALFLPVRYVVRYHCGLRRQVRVFVHLYPDLRQLASDIEKYMRWFGIGLLAPHLDEKQINDARRILAYFGHAASLGRPSA